MLGLYVEDASVCGYVEIIIWSQLFNRMLEKLGLSNESKTMNITTPAIQEFFSISTHKVVFLGY